MAIENPRAVTRILAAFTGGDRAAVNRLHVILYPALRALAHRQVRCADNSISPERRRW